VPRVIVVAECGPGPVAHVDMEGLLVGAHVQSGHASGEVIKRLGWVIVDDGALERASQPNRRTSMAPTVMMSLEPPRQHADEHVRVDSHQRVRQPTRRCDARARRDAAQVEEFIERQPISEEDRSVLWLRAWVESLEQRPRTHCGWLMFDGETDTDASRAPAARAGVLAIARRAVWVPQPAAVGPELDSQLG
jgi:hypothetical protein